MFIARGPHLRLGDEFGVSGRDASVNERASRAPESTLPNGRVSAYHYLPTIRTLKILSPRTILSTTLIPVSFTLPKTV